MIKKFLKLFLILDLAVVAFCLVQGEMIWLMNTQAAFFSSLVITLGSYFGYKKNIQKRVENTQVDVDEPDTIDKMEDPYDLYSELNEQEDFTKEEIKEIIKEEKKKLRSPTQSIKNTVFSFGAFSSVYRILGYLLLVISFFYLNNNGLFDAIPFLLGLSVVPIMTIVMSFKMKTEDKIESENS